MFEHRAFDGKNWFYGTAFRQDKEDSTIWWFYDDVKNEWIMVMTPEMWSGLHDRNNKKIYERDVISNGKRKGIVWFTKGEFWIEWLDGEFYQSRLNMLHEAYVVINNTTELERSGEYYESFRVKAWFRVIPKPAVVDFERFERIGAKNMEKLTRASLKNKTAIQIITNENVKNIINENLKC